MDVTKAVLRGKWIALKIREKISQINELLFHLNKLEK